MEFKPLTPDETAMIQLYQQLSLDQCVELFKKNYDNYRKLLKTKLYIIIAAKYIWGKDYVINYHKNTNKDTVEPTKPE